jgi:Putative Ig domain
MNSRRIKNWFFRCLLLVIAVAQFAACNDETQIIIHTTPAITSANNTLLFTGSAGTFTFTATGSPTPTIAVTGTLPSGVTFDAATGVLSGTPAGGSGGTYPLTVTATNSISPDATQNFTLQVVTASIRALLVTEATSVVDTDNTNIANLMTVAGLTVDTSTGIPTGDLSVYAQIWDTRFNQIPLTYEDMLSYKNYLAGGRTLVLIGENAGFATRNNSILAFISELGGGSITLSTPNNGQTVHAPFTGPNAVTSITILASDGTSNPGTGALMMQDANGIGGGIYFARGTLSNAVGGRLMVVFDVNFLGTNADADSHNLAKNMIVLP